MVNSSNSQENIVVTWKRGASDQLKGVKKGFLEGKSERGVMLRLYLEEKDNTRSCSYRRKW